MMLLVYAHADDELIWGWPFLSDCSIEKKILICSCDENNPSRSWIKGQKKALEELARKCGHVEMISLMPFFSEFSRLPARAASGNLLKDWWTHFQESFRVMSVGCDSIATHNPWGEYGHQDHLLVRRAVLESPHLGDKQIYCTDAHYQTKTWPVGSPPNLPGWGSQQSARQRVLDQQWFNDLRQCYVDYGCYTWDNPVPELVHIFD